ncbi:MAG: hypothetical protein EOO03_13705, partial [Chitinophagaceae bacterium]
GMPDMKLPIQYALTYPGRIPSNFKRYDFKKPNTLSFEEPDIKTFRNLALAIEALENSNRLLPNANDVLLLSKLYAETKNPVSLQLADLLVKQGQFTKEAILIKGLYYKSVGDYKNALLFFDEAITAAYTFVEAYREKALLHYENAEYMEALRVLDKAVKIRAAYAEGYFLMGQCFEKLNRPEDAKESYETALIYQADYDEASKALASVNKLLQ